MTRERRSRLASSVPEAVSLRRSNFLVLGYPRTSSARARNASGIVMPSALAVVQLERSGCLEHDLEERAKGRYGC